MVSLNLTASLAIVKCLLTCIMALSLKTQYKTENCNKMPVQNGENLQGIYYLLTFLLLTKVTTQNIGWFKEYKNLYTEGREVANKDLFVKATSSKQSKTFKSTNTFKHISSRIQAAVRRQKPADLICTPTHPPEPVQYRNFVILDLEIMLSIRGMDIVSDT